MSGYYLELEIRQTWEGMDVAVPEESWEAFREASAREMAAALRQIAGHVDLHRYRKSVRGPKKKPPAKKPYKNGSHVSTAKVLREHRSGA